MLIYRYEQIFCLYTAIEALEDILAMLNLKRNNYNSARSGNQA